LHDEGIKIFCETTLLIVMIICFIFYSLVCTFCL